MSYKHLTKEERYYIEQRKANNPAISLRILGSEMNRSHTTLSRELRRNLDPEFGFYSGIRAETLAINRKKSVNVLTRKMLKISEIVSKFLFDSFLLPDI